MDEEQQSLRTDVEPDNDVRFSFPVPLPVSTWLIERLTDPTLSHPPATYYYTRAHRARRGTRESTRFQVSFQPNSLPPSLPPSLWLFRTLLSREDDESSATKSRSFQNGRVQCKRVGQIVLLALPLCVSRNGNGLPGGDDAGGRASTARAQLRYPGCAHSLRNNREGLWDPGATFIYTYLLLISQNIFLISFFSLLNNGNSIETRRDDKGVILFYRHEAICKIISASNLRRRYNARVYMLKDDATRYHQLFITDEQIESIMFRNRSILTRVILRI